MGTTYRNIVSDSVYEQYYVYRHVRLDTNEVFYIGIGKKSNIYKTFNGEYARAFNKAKRSGFWKNITNKTKYSIEILFESHNGELILQKEIEYIKLYGRRDLGMGTLVNLTDGGEGVPNHIYTEEHLDRISAIMSLRMRDRNNMSWCTKIYQYDMQGNFIKEWEAKIDACRYYNIATTSLSNSLNKNDSPMGGFFWYSKFQGYNIKIADKFKSRNRKGVIMLDKNTGEKLEVFNTMTDALNIVKLKYPNADIGHISACCKNKKPSIYGYKWEYKCQ